MSFPAYDTTKDSGVEWLGAVPSHWNCVPLKAVASCNDDVLKESTAPDQDIEYVEISDVAYGKGIVGSTIMPFADAPSRARRRVVHGDVLVSTVRTYLRAIACVRSPAPEMVVSTGFAVLRPRLIHSGFLGHLMLSEYVVGQIISQSVGVSYPAINAHDAMRIDVPLPPYSEQTAIAAFLDRETAKIDALIAEQQRLIDLLKEKRQAVISHAVTKGLNPDAPMKDSGVEWLGEVPEHWEVVRLRRVSSRVQTGGTPTSEVPSADLEEGVAWFTPGDFSDKLILTNAAKKVTRQCIEDGDARLFPGLLPVSWTPRKGVS